MSAICQNNASLCNCTSFIWNQQWTALHLNLFSPLNHRESICWVLREENRGCKRWKAKGGISWDNYCISEVRTAKLTDGPVQTTHFSPQELSLNFSAAGRHTWREGERVWGANVEMEGYEKYGGEGSNVERKKRGKYRESWERPKHWRMSVCWEVELEELDEHTLRIWMVNGLANFSTTP